MFLNVFVEFSALFANTTSVLPFSVICEIVSFPFFAAVKHLVAALTFPVAQGLESGNGCYFSHSTKLIKGSFILALIEY